MSAISGRQHAGTARMADPQTYARGYSFTAFQAASPSAPLPAPRVDVELDDISASIASLVSGVKDIRRADGALKNGVVTLDSLSAGVLAGLANLDDDAAALIDAAILSVRTDLSADIAAVDAAKAELVHTHVATAVSVSAITGIVGATVQAVLAELRALGPQTGDVRQSIDDTVSAGWVACDDGTIGAGLSSATNRHNDDTRALYLVLWNKVSDTYAPVTGGRGVSATLDFEALKPIGLTKMLGRALGVAGSAGGLTSRANGEIDGTETLTLARSALPNVTVTYGGTFQVQSGGQPALTPNTASGVDIVTNVGPGSVFSYAAYSVAGVTISGVTSSLNGNVSQTAITKAVPTVYLHTFLKL